MAARINIDVDFWIDPRIDALAEEVGCKYKARGMVLTAINIAQRYWAPKNVDEQRGLIPKDIWELMNLSKLIDVGLAIEQVGGIYLKGSQERFEWIITAQNNGKKGGRPKKPQVSESIENKEPNHNPTLTGPLPDPNLLTLTLIPTLNKNNIYTPECQPSKTSSEGTYIESEWENLGKAWLDFGIEKIPHGKNNKNWNAQAFGKELKRVSKLTSVPIEKLTALLDFAKKDDFWSKQLASPFGLATKKNNGNRKLDNALLSMDGNKTKITKPRKMIVGGEY